MSQRDLKPELFSGTKIIHMTGITPVLSCCCREMTEEVFALAKQKGTAVSFDPNIRQKPVSYTHLDVYKRQDR